MKYLIHIIIFKKKKIIWKRDLVNFLWFFIFIIVMCIWKVCLFRNILIVEINTHTKE